MRTVTNWLVLIVSMLCFAAMPALAQTRRAESSKVFVTFVKTGLDLGCSDTVGLVEQSLMRLEGVKNARVDPKNYGVNVSYDAKKTAPDEIIAAFNTATAEFPSLKLKATQP